MPSINLDFGFFGHPKTCKLIGLLGHDADVLPLRLWCYCGTYFAGSGKLSGLNAGAVERVMGWRGQRGKAVEALLEVGFLELDADGVTFVVHDWLDHSGHLAVYQERAKNAAKARWDKARRQSATSNATSNATIAPSITTATTPPPTPAPSLYDEPELGHTYSDAAMRLKIIWEGRYSRRGGVLGAGAFSRCAAYFEDLMKIGKTEKELKDEILREDRLQTEAIWEFAKRLGLEVKKNDSSNSGHSGRIHDPAISAKAAARSIKV